MSKQKICAYCGKPISWIVSVIFNNCCSYHCDISLEKEMKHGNPQPNVDIKYKQKSPKITLDPKFINNDEDSYDYGFNDDNIENVKSKVKKHDVFYPQIENPIDTFGYLTKNEPVEVDVKPSDPYQRGEYQENKNSGYYPDINGESNYYDNGETGFFSNRNSGYYDDVIPDNTNDTDDIFIDDYSNNDNGNDDYYYNEDEDYQIMHNHDDE